MTLLTYLEQVDRSANSPCTGGFSIDGSKTTRPWLVLTTSQGGNGPPTVTDLIAGINEILGSTNFNPSGNGKINRTMPLADPQYEWLYASSIDAIIGKGGQFVVNFSNQFLDVPAFAQYAQYPAYVFLVTSRPRPYSVAQDDEVTQQSGQYYPVLDNGNSTFSLSQGSSTIPVNSPQHFLYVNEWVRFTDFDNSPIDEYATAQAGQMAFFTNGTQTPDANAVPFPGQPRMYIPNEWYYLYWYQVPYRLISSKYSYINRWKGRVNQNVLNWPGGPFQPGTILYDSYTHKKYNPPVQTIVQSVFDDTLSLFSTEKLCDITFKFKRTERFVPDPPSTVSSINPNRNITLGNYDGNKGYFVGGHNCLPWLLDRNFHAAFTTISAGGASPSKNPAFQSAPLELLMTDCDSPLNGGGQNGPITPTGGLGP